MSKKEEKVVENPDKPKTEGESIQMSDGRFVTFAGKRKMLKTVSEDSKSVRFDFRNGETREFTIPHGEIAHKLAAHGAAQKIGDETAGVEDLGDMVIAVEAVIDRLHKGEWGATRQAGDSFSGASIVIKAVCEVTGKSVEDVKAFIEKKLASTEGLTRAALYQSFRNPASKTGQVIARLEAEKAAKKGTAANADELLSELG